MDTLFLATMTRSASPATACGRCSKTTAPPTSNCATTRVSTRALNGRCSARGVRPRNHGEHGVEAQYFVNNELWQACRFLDRAWATRWAERVRAEVLRGQHAWP